MFRTNWTWESKVGSAEGHPTPFGPWGRMTSVTAPSQIPQIVLGAYLEETTLG